MKKMTARRALNVSSAIDGSSGAYMFFFSLVLEMTKMKTGISVTIDFRHTFGKK